MLAPTYQILRATSPEEKQQCYDLRTAIFHIEQGFPLETEFDEYDEEPSTAHFLLRLTPSLVPAGTIRAIRPHGASYYKLTRFGVLEPYRAHRFGAALTQRLHEWVLKEAMENAAKMPEGTRPQEVVIKLHSQIHAKGFYAKQGYVSEGPEFDEDGAPHQKMVLRIPLPSVATAQATSGSAAAAQLRILPSPKSLSFALIEAKNAHKHPPIVIRHTFVPTVAAQGVPHD